LYPVETNAVFLKMKPEIFHLLSRFACFNQWNVEKDEVRFVFSFGNTKKELKQFMNEYRKLYNVPQPARLT